MCRVDIYEVLRPLQELLQEYSATNTTIANAGRGISAYIAQVLHAHQHPCCAHGLFCTRWARSAVAASLCRRLVEPIIGTQPASLPAACSDSSSCPVHAPVVVGTWLALRGNAFDFRPLHYGNLASITTAPGCQAGPCRAPQTPGSCAC